MKRLILFLKRSGLVINIILAGSLLLSYLAPFVPPDLFWPLVFFGLLFPFLFILNLFFLVFWLIQRSRNFILPFLVMLIGLGHFNTFVQFKGSHKSKGSGIKVLSYNINYFSHNKKNKPLNIEHLLDYLKNSSSDIICLQEVSLARSGKLSAKGLEEVLPNMHYYQLAYSIRTGGSATYSRFPVINYGEIHFPDSFNMILFSDIKISESQIIRVYNCHFQSFQIVPEKYTIIENPTSGSNRLKFREILQLGHKLVTAYKMRAQQARTVARHVKQCPYPVILCGDFNDTPWSYTYRIVMDSLKDSFVESGYGISNTYNGKLPSFRIDYILHSRIFSSFNYERDRVPFSDHFPISSYLELEKPK